MACITPSIAAHVEREGVRTHYEIHGDGAPTLLLLPAWSIVHSRLWKAQIPYLSRHYRVITFDGRGSGRSDRPLGVDAHMPREYVEDAVAVLDATETKSAVAVGLSFGGHLGAMLAALYPERIDGAVLIAPAAPFGEASPHRTYAGFTGALDSTEGWAKYNRHYWRDHYPEFARFFFERALCEPHSTKQIEDAVGWALETTPDLLTDTVLARFAASAGKDEGEELYARIRCPVLVIHGDRDEIVPYAKGGAVARVTRGRLVTMEGSGHVPQARDPVPINLLIRDFVDGLVPPASTRHPTRISRGLGRRKRALYLSSPIGLGHARRDLAIAHELRALHPDLEIDWLTQHPVTALLENAGERVHPASRHLLNESRHIESEAKEHELHVFQALRRMDEILVANFMLFQDVIEGGRYDLTIGDEAWDVDHFWHEHPELKRGALAWLTDFVGYLPMPEGGADEARLTADYNAEMIEHIARYPRVRDRAIFVGNRDDIVPDTFGPDLPDIRAWTEAHFAFSGYVIGQHPDTFGERSALRESLGYARGEKVCIAAVGGSGVGSHLLRRIMRAYPAVRRRIPELRMIVVAGPRIAADSLPQTEGIEVRGFVPDLPQHFAACDLALVQGGLTTCMELAAAGTPFLYFPLRNHFEQNFHVRHRLERYGAGRCMEFAATEPEALAEAMAREIDRDVARRPVEGDGARRAARILAELL
jgi:pimeloyl-ACP methyl ester carboxylesterase/predicted glycosyltransferase